MESYSLADAKARLSALIDAVEHGESVTITRRGKPAARLVPVVARKQPVDLARLEELTAAMPLQKETAGSFVRAMRNADRY